MLFIIFGEMSCNDNKDGYSVWSKCQGVFIHMKVQEHTVTLAVSLVLKLSLTRLLYLCLLVITPTPGHDNK